MNGDIQLMTALVQNVSVNASTVNEKFCRIRHTVKRCCTPFGMAAVLIVTRQFASQTVTGFL